MVPSALVVLERLPLTPNGKLDRRALPEPELRSGACAIGRRGRRRRRCCARCLPRCWGVDRVGIDDNFFELGGDSIVSIQLVSRARRAGLSITPRAGVPASDRGGAGGGGRSRRRRQRARLRSWRPAAACGAVLPATPIMRWLKERGGPLDRFSQSMLLRVPAGLRQARPDGGAAGGAGSSRCAAAAARLWAAGWRLAA